ncbi:hypothetical protein Ancab_030571 [Ancistrocladus abbreviatus]
MASSNAASSDLVSSVISPSLRSVLQIFINEMHELTAKVFNDLRSLELYWKSNIEAQVKIYRNVSSNPLLLGTGVVPVVEITGTSALGPEMVVGVFLIKSVEHKPLLDHQHKYLLHRINIILSGTRYLYRLDELKNSLNIGGGQLQSEVQDSRTTHQQQQEELMAILKGVEELEYQNKYLSVELRKVISELKDRRTNLRKCRVDATPSLSNRLQDASNDKKAVQEQKLCEETAQDMKSEAANAKISSGENDAENSMNESTKSGAEISLAKL